MLEDILGAAQVAVGISGLLGGGGQGKVKLHGWQERGLKGAILRNTAIAEMLQDPNDPRFQALAAEEESGIRSGFQSGIRELLTANNRARARGLAGILNPERQDEGISSATATAFEMARNEARNRVRTYLQSAANVNANLMGAMPTPLPSQGMNPLAALDVIGRGLGNIQGALNGGGTPGSGGQNINLNFGGQGAMGLPSRRGYSG
jgi:hypothetical protein